MCFEIYKPQVIKARIETMYCENTGELKLEFSSENISPHCVKVKHQLCLDARVFSTFKTGAKFFDRNSYVA